VLSRRLATAGHFPAIEVLDSISRVGPAVTTPEQRALAAELRRLLAAYRDARDLIEVGAYSKGASRVVDRAVELKDLIDAFLRQDMSITSLIDDSWAMLEALLAPGDEPLVTSAAATASGAAPTAPGTEQLAS
jgi:flagellum-specific ATP synthase